MILDANLYLRRRKKNLLTRYRLASRTNKIVKVIKKYTGAKGNLRLLDIGAADGAMLSALNSELNLEKAVGIEPLDELRKVVNDPNIKVLPGYGEKLPFSESEFDAVIIASVIEHVKDGEKLLTESYRVLKKGGLLIITAVDPFFDKIATFLGFKPNDHYRTYNLKELKKLFISTGFQVKLAKKFGPLFYELIVGEK